MDDLWQPIIVLLDVWCEIEKHGASDWLKQELGVPDSKGVRWSTC